MRRRAKRLAVAAEIGTVERAVEHVGGFRLLGLGHALAHLLAVDAADGNVIAVLDQHLGQAESDTVLLEHVGLVEDHAAALVRDRSAFTHLRGGAQAVHDRFHLVGALDTGLDAHELAIFLAKVIHAVEVFAQDRLDENPKLG